MEWDQPLFTINLALTSLSLSLLLFKIEIILTMELMGVGDEVHVNFLTHRS
jgi:hypothetical protein